MDTPTRAEPIAHPSFREALTFWLALGFLSFGGPTGQIALMHQELVEKKRWISNERFLHALNYCMLLPGPEAQQLATYVGWLLHKTLGGIVAGTLFVLPSAIILWCLSFIYVSYGHVEWVVSIFYGLKPAVLAIVIAAVVRIGKKTLRNEVMWSLALTSFVAIFLLRFPFPVIIGIAAIAGLFGGVYWKSKFVPSRASSGSSGTTVTAILDDESTAPLHTKPSLSRSVKVVLVSLVVWWVPIVLAGLTLGFDHTVFRQGLFFSKAAMVTFGGAYAVLPYVSQQAVETHHWLTANQMLDGLGLAETTPGPLIIVLQFVGFVGAWNQPGQLPPLISATLGSFITTWSTFVPCFLWIFLGAPHIEQLRRNVPLAAALAAVTAAVVGVILNLAVWFGLYIIFPDATGFDHFSALLTLVSLAALLRFKVPMIYVILASALLGLLSHALF